MVATEPSTSHEIMTGEHLGNLLSEQVRLNPEGVAVISGDDELTFAGLAENASGVAGT